MNNSSPGLLRRLYGLWLCVVLLCGAGLIWAVCLLAPAPEERPTAPSGSAQSGAPAGMAEAKAPAAQAPIPPAVVPSFDADSAQYVLTAFSLQGMQHVTDAGSFDLLLPGNVLTAQLIRRGPTPEPVMKGVTLRYTLDPQTAMAAGAEGLRKGELHPQPDTFSYASLPIPVLPYSASAPVSFNPYPLVTVEAVNAKGEVLATTNAVLPVSTEMGCLNCHTGSWKTAGVAGISEATAGQILAVHDRRNRTTLVEQAAGGKKVNCLSCHGSVPERLNLSTAIHGFHASMGLVGQEGCASCHPAAESGHTRFSRDIHALWQLECTRCHGGMEQHAASLLLAEKAKGKRAAASRLQSLGQGNAAPASPAGQDSGPSAAQAGSSAPRETAAAGAVMTPAGFVVPRTPWVNLPQCAGCHDFQAKPAADTASAVNKWTKDASELFSQSVENTGKLRCPSCHGSPHAVYPATSPLGDERDNLQPLQYQQAAAPLGAGGKCGACHMQPMDYSVHHDLVE